MPGPNTVPHARPEADSAESGPTRRRFLMGTALAAAAAGTAAAAAGTAATASHLVQAPAASASPPADAADDGATGYRLSEHIRKYYKTTWI